MAWKLSDLFKGKKAPEKKLTNRERFAPFMRLDPSVLFTPDASLHFLTPPEEGVEYLTIGPDSQIFSTFHFQGPSARIQVGARSQIGASHIVATDNVRIGDDVFMAWGCTIIDSNNHSVHWEHRRHDLANYRKDYEATGGRYIAMSHAWGPVETAPVMIGDKCWLGFNVIVLKGVTIGEGSVIGAGSVVSRDIPPWSLAGGNPCKVLKTLPEYVPGENRP